MHFLKKLTTGDYRSFLFLISLLLYGFFSSPTPDNPTIIEALIFVGLFFAVGFSSFLLLHTKKEKWEWAGIALLGYGIIISCSLPLLHGHGVTTVIRDLIGFIFLLLPLFFIKFITQKNEHTDYLLYSALAIGLAFSIRVLFMDFSFFTEKQTLLYLANSPLVLFTALFLSLSAFDKLTHGHNFQQGIKFITLALLTLLPLFAMFIDFQRASFIALGFALFGYISINIFKRPLKIIFPAIILISVSIIFFEYAHIVIENIQTKTAKVGLNMRTQEALAVWDHVRSSPLTLLFGYGWGSEFQSPAVGNLHVPFTHSLLSYMLLKTGLIGLFLTVVYLGFIFEKLRQLVLIKPIEFNALLWPLIIPILFYASYKSFDFGLVLTLILALTCKFQKAQTENKNE